jgi:hypothetical protein
MVMIPRTIFQKKYFKLGLHIVINFSFVVSRQFRTHPQCGHIFARFEINSKQSGHGVKLGFSTLNTILQAEQVKSVPITHFEFSS